MGKIKAVSVLQESSSNQGNSGCSVLTYTETIAQAHQPSLYRLLYIRKMQLKAVALSIRQVAFSY